MKRISVVLALSCLFSSAFAQNPFRGKIKLDRSWEVERVDKVKVKQTAKPGDLIKTTWSTKVGNKEIVQIRETLVTNDTTSLPPVIKEKKVDMRGLTGVVSLSASSEQPNTINVNYYLQRECTVKSGMYVKQYKRIWRSPTDTVMIEVLEKEGTLKKCQKYRMYKIDGARKKVDMSNDKLFIKGLLPQERQDKPSLYPKNKDKWDENWAKYAKSIIEVYKDSSASTPEYCLVERYGREDNYIVELPNRRSVRVNASNWDLGALILPVKYRFGYDQTRNGSTIQVHDQVESDINIGVFGGWSYGLERYRFESGAGKGELKRQYSIKGTFGLFASVGKQEIDSLSSTAAETPLATDVKRTIAAASLGAGLMLSVNDIKFGFICGWDIGMGSAAKLWNYHARPEPWIGFGLGYNLAGITIKAN